MHSSLANPALTVALAASAGVLSLVLAQHLRVPGIVILLAAGVLLGPDVAGVVRPETLGAALPILVEFAVAIILFEGGLNLDFRRLRREAPAIRRLVTVGGLVTAIGGCLLARACMQWDWRPAILFGALVIVTGPTVITPLLRRIKVRRDVETILEAEGVLIDPIGAIFALVTLQVVLSPSLAAVGSGAMGVATRLGLGLVCGALGGLALGGLLRWGRAIPEGLESIVTLGTVLGLVKLSDAVLPETGIMTATVAGLVLGNIRTRVHRDLKEFKEQLTQLMIGLLFVLLAANVRLAGVAELGGRGLLTVLGLMLVVRPLNILVSTVGLPLPWRQRAFLAWLAPRGIVAAAVASHFALTLGEAGFAGGPELLTLVFLVIAVTVVVQGLSGDPIARLLGVSRGRPTGVCIFGANKLARVVAQQFRLAGLEVVLIESRSDFSQQAEVEGLRVVFGNGLEERTLLRARIDARRTAIGLTDNEEANLIFVERARHEFKVREVFVALREGHGNVKAAMVEEAGARVLFGREVELERWSVRFERELASLEVWELHGIDVSAGYAAAEDPARDAAAQPAAAEDEAGTELEFDPAILPLTWRRGERIEPFATGTRFRVGDRLHIGLFVDEADRAEAWLRSRGWVRIEAEETRAGAVTGRAAGGGDAGAVAGGRDAGAPAGGRDAGVARGSPHSDAGGT